MSLRFAVDLWDQFEEVVKKVSCGKDFTEAAADFIHKRSQIEKEYSRKLIALCKSVEKEAGTLFAGWTSLKDETENIAKKHGELSEALLYSVEEPLQNFLKDTKKTRAALRDMGRKTIKDVQAAEAKVGAAKLAFEQARKKQDEAKEEYERAAFTNQQPPIVEKLSKKMKAETKKATMLDGKYREAVDGCRQLQDKYYDEEMPRILEDYQDMEQTRLEKTKVAFQSYIELQRSVSPEILSSCDRMAVVVKNISAPADLQGFIAEKRTNAPQPDRTVYETYNPELGRCVKTDGSGSLTSSQRITAPVRSVQTSTVTTATTQPRSAPAPASSGPARKGISKCRALFDYSAEDPNELSFRAGEIIVVLQKDPSGWWQGELNGRIGVFPSVDWVEELSENGTPIPIQLVSSKKQCRAVYDYAADGEYELSITAGEILSVDVEEEGWYCGSNVRGQYGRYPANYVELI